MPETIEAIQELTAKDITVIKDNTPSLLPIFVLVIFLMLATCITLAGSLLFGIFFMIFIAVAIFITIVSRHFGDKDLLENKKLVVSGKILEKVTQTSEDDPVRYYIKVSKERDYLKYEIWKNLEIGDSVEVHRSIHSKIILCIKKL